MRYLAAAFLVLCALAPAAGARQLDCARADDTADMDACAGQDFMRADTALNALYKQMHGRYDMANRALLVSAERAWIGWRDAECAYETGLSVGGTAHPMVETMCKTRLTNARIQQLRTQMSCPDGDLDCNRP